MAEPELELELCAQCQERPAADTFADGEGVCLECWASSMSVPWESRREECLRCGETAIGSGWGWAYEVTWYADWDDHGNGAFICSDCWARD